MPFPTRDGYLWLGTQNGLVRFDGLQFKSVPIDLPQALGQNVKMLSQAHDGGLWFAINHGGLGHFDGQRFAAIGDHQWSRPDMSANAILEAHDGALWMGELLGLGRWGNGQPGESFLDEKTTGPVLSFGEGPAGKIWLGTSEHGLFYWADGKLVSCPDEVLKHRNISALAVDAENQVWVGTQLGLLCYSHGQVKEISGQNYNVNALLVDRQGGLWIGTTGRGLGRYENGRFTFLGKVDGLASDNVTALFEDAEGSLWVGTQDGLSQLSDVKFPIFTSKEGLGEGSCRLVTASKNGGLWIATDNGISYLNGPTATNLFANPALPNNYFKLCFEARNGDIYAEDGDKGMDILSGNRLRSRITNSVWVSAFAEDAQSVLASLGTGDSLFRIQAGKLVHYQYQDGATPDYYWINNMCTARDGAVWVASKNGIFRLDDGRVQHWTTAEGLSGNIVQWICEDGDGSIWAGLTTGIARIKNGQVKNLTSTNGLADNLIFSIVPDDRGVFWFDSGRSIFRASRQDLNAFADGLAAQVQCELFDGLEALKFTGRTDQEFSGCKTLDGRVWFPSPWGVVMIDPAHIPTNAVPPPVHIVQVLANGKECARSGKIVAPPGQGELNIRFNALSYLAPQKIQFRYQLAGYDKDWIEAGDRPLAVYANLKPGNYTFHVIAANADGVWSPVGASLQIELRPHFYQTLWFYIPRGGSGRRRTGRHRGVARSAFGTPAAGAATIP